MKYLLLASVLFIFSFSCKEPLRRSTSCFVEPRPNIKSLLDSFVGVTGQSYSEYGVYIDKTSPHDYDLIVYAGKEPLTKEEDRLNNQEAIQKARVSDIEFKIYSGVEHYFQNTVPNDTAILKRLSKGGENVIWAVKDSFGVMTIYKVEGAYPFIALPVRTPHGIKFKMPVSDSSAN
jgi:hypothetical protein